MRLDDTSQGSLCDERDDTQRAYRIGVGPICPSDDTGLTSDHVGHIQLSAISAIQYGMSRLFHGRVFNSERVDMGMARNWLDECETHHKQKCTLPDMTIGGSATPAGPRDLLVVDVLRMNLCRMPRGSRYIALSYCWPKVNAFVTTKSNVTELYIPGALKDNEERMIQAIKDAIHCVSELGERYLWVDALCIVQDDEEHKSSQIRQMDLVYGFSLLTLIHAAPAARAQAETLDGLVGYCKGSRITKQDIYQVQGMELLIPFSDVDSVIRRSRWTSRAWTYQEEKLSRRRLYFTETQMYFQCSCAVFCEDSVGEGINPSAFIYPSINLWNSRRRYSPRREAPEPLRPWLCPTPGNATEEALALYSRSLTEFSGRRMSNPRDILASFEGILSVFRKSLNTSFFFGLPRRYLDESLLWIECGPRLRRNISITPSAKTTFPSWSWAGWNAKIELESIFAGDVCPEVKWFVISESGETEHVVTHSAWIPSHTTSDNRNVRPPARLPIDCLNIALDECYIPEWREWEFPRFLACWTCIALFGISDEKVDVEKKLGTTWELREHLPVLDNVGHWAGSVFMSQGWKEDIKGNSRTFEFMLLSRSSTLNEHLKYFDEDIFTSRRWGLLNVMLIQRDGYQAQRVGVGVIHEDAWVEASPIPMVIILE